MKHIYIILTVVLTIATQSISIHKSYAQSMISIDKQIQKYEYSESIELLQLIIKKDGKRSLEAKEKIALCYRLMNKPDSAAKWYAEVIKEEEIHPDNHFYYAQMLRTLGKYKKAEFQFLTYDSIVLEDKKGALLYAQYCKDIIPLVEKADKYNLWNVSIINTEYDEFSPIVYKNSLVFTSDRPKEVKRSKTYSWTGSSYLDLYSSNIDFENTIQELSSEDPKIFNTELSQTYHDGTAVFTKDWKTVYFTRTNKERVKRGVHPVATIVLKLYKSEYIDGHWKEAEPFYLNSNEYSVGHPSLSADETQLFFASDMPKGYGGTDIYSCSLEDNKWVRVKNLGNTINTSENEMFPNANEKDKLYFASSGHLGFGGLDIFSSVLENGKWQEPKNLGKPINSSYDDFGICWLEQGKGFISSNRPGGKGNDDIYAIEFKPLILSGKVVSDSGYVIMDATVFLLNENSQEVLILKTDSLGRYETIVDANTSYTILAKKTDYLDDCLAIDVADINVNPNDLILSKLYINRVFAVDNIYYDLDKSFIRADAEPELDKVVEILNEHTIIIELSSHTDCRATDSYNQKLSQRRAEAAVDYILSQGIDSTRITAKGYGETQLINECADGVKCTEDQHQLNRRTEFKIIQLQNQDDDIIDPLSKYLAGELYQKEDFDDEYFKECIK